MSEKKKLKVEIPESALKNVPEDQREALKAEILKMFEGMDIEDIKGKSQPVYYLKKEDGLVCANCKGPLKPFKGSSTMPDGTVSQLWDCEACDLAFETEALD